MPEKKPICGILAGEPEIIGERCADGGKCHHRCTDTCLRRSTCTPLSGSGLRFDWSPVDPSLSGIRDAAGDRFEVPFAWLSGPAEEDPPMSTKLYAEPSALASHGNRVSLAPERSGRIYIAGPMTGLPDFNFQAFNDMAAILRGLGYHVENPAEHGVVEGAEWADYLRYDIARLATCEALVLLPGWRHSRGALLEVHIAKALGIQIMFAEVFSRFDAEEGA